MEGKRIDGPEENESNRAWYKVAWGREKGYSRLGDEDTLHEWGIKHIFWEKGLKALFRAVFTPLMDMTGEQGERNKKTSVHPFYAAVMSTSDQDLGICCGSMIGVLFGGVHLIGWDFRFPTLTELWLWRASSLVLVTIPVFFVVASIGSYAEEKSTSNLPYVIRRVFSMPALTVAPPLYLAARVIILFQAFFALRDLPESAYENVKWTEFIPHI
ncbi:hypothetical protein AX16_009487 [Volvariella volvacea WC 439]|nr:hypothetical protein AX16_009487 [Volvariella volvacea WC 439]